VFDVTKKSYQRRTKKQEKKCQKKRRTFVKKKKEKKRFRFFYVDKQKKSVGRRQGIRSDRAKKIRPARPACVVRPSKKKGGAVARPPVAFP
jgi:hypothetical protein